MHDVNHAVAALRSAIGLDEIEFGSGNQIDLLFDEDMRLSLVKIDDQTLELAAPIERPGVLERPALVALLKANHLGRGTGAGRLALDPEDESILFCRRVDVGGVDAGQLETLVLEFVEQARAWNTDPPERVAEREVPPASEASDDPEMLMIRG